MLDVDGFTVSRWIDKGLIPAFRTGGGHRRVEEADLRAFLASRQLQFPKELEAPAGDKVRLLIVDDEQPVLRGLRRAFRQIAPEVDVVATGSGIEALLKLALDKPNGMLIDLCMPGLDGVEVIRRVSDIPALASVKLVAMTARATREVCDSALKAGALACLQKPVKPAEVLNLVAARPTAPRKT